MSKSDAVSRLLAEISAQQNQNQVVPELPYPTSSGIINLNDPNPSLGTFVRLYDPAYSSQPYQDSLIGTTPLAPSAYHPPSSSSSSKTSYSFPVKSCYVGMLIGKRGEKLQKMESATKTRVQFMPETPSKPGERMAIITGQTETIDMCRREISQKIKDYQDVLTATAFPAIAHGVGGNHHPTYETPDPFVIPEHHIGLVIGKGGEKIRDLQEATDTKIIINTDTDLMNPLRPVSFQGSPDGVSRAKSIIQDIIVQEQLKINSLSTTSNPNKVQTDVMAVPRESVGMIIGRGGETVREIYAKTMCQLKISPDGGPSVPEREITFIGTPSSVELAKWDVLERLERAGVPLRRLAHPPIPPAASIPPTNVPGTAMPMPMPEPYPPYGDYENYMKAWQQYPPNPMYPK
ncbi:KH domain-containing protein [Schizosaccharomyces cryophilus OY26]|uniref:KH domain-containing protein n=1 Tax=Schizosaccharomyces cryophilus (strain OY26 / ATCC MYA-4695 / CBS 11777 / NBRC 106824 / NRRL Y48691) TaxID=653667 RepID=S9VTH4_SCHCR|nr:KH domain-containing protein [Schizosaccharomyces cryophilus OY26]EPY49345.1 KH domain-containing protein [Schizosaccharomyces cryophilus OY26]